MEYYSAIKKHKKTLFVITWMDLEGSMLSEISQTEAKFYYLSYMWNLKKNLKSKKF